MYGKKDFVPVDIALNARFFDVHDERAFALKVSQFVCTLFAICSGTETPVQTPMPKPPKKKSHANTLTHGSACDAMTIGHIRSRWASSAVSDYIQVVPHICVKPFHYRRANSIDSIPLRLVKIEFKAFGVHFKKRRTPAHPTADKTPAPQSTHSHPPKM